MAYLQAPHAGAALLCYPGKAQDMLSEMLKGMKGRDSSPAFMATWPDLHPAIDGKEGEGQSVSLPHLNHYMGGE